MGNCVEESDREQIIQSILSIRFPGDRPEERFGAEDLRRKLEKMDLEKLEETERLAPENM